MHPCAPEWTVHANIHARSIRTDVPPLQEPPPGLAERGAQRCGILPPAPASWAARGKLSADNLTLQQRPVESRSLLLRDAVKAHTVWENLGTEATRRDPEKARGFVVGSSTVSATQPGSVWARRDSSPVVVPTPSGREGTHLQTSRLFLSGDPSASPQLASTCPAGRITASDAEPIREHCVITGRQEKAKVISPRTRAKARTLDGSCCHG